MNKPFGVIINTFFYVSLLVLLGITAIYHSYIDGAIPMEFLWYSMICGAASAIISFVFFTEQIIKNCPYTLRFLFFFLCLVGSVGTASHFFRIVDFSVPGQVVQMLLMIGVIFAVVWCAQLFIYKQQERELTDKLREFNESFDD